MNIQTNTLQTIPSSSKAQVPVAEISGGMIQYFRSRLGNRVHEIVITEFREQEKLNDLTRAELARRLNKKPEQITRWLASPGNWTIDTISDLLLGMGCELGLTSYSIASQEDSVLKAWGGVYAIEESSQADVLIFEPTSNCFLDRKLSPYHLSQEVQVSLTRSTVPNESRK